MHIEQQGEAGIHAVGDIAFDRRRGNSAQWKHRGSNQHEPAHESHYLGLGRGGGAGFDESVRRVWVSVMVTSSGALTKYPWMNCTPSCHRTAMVLASSTRSAIVSTFCLTAWSTSFFTAACVSKLPA